jgi:hypothetical protein
VYNECQGQFVKDEDETDPKVARWHKPSGYKASGREKGIRKKQKTLKKNECGGGKRKREESGEMLTRQ